LNVVAVGLLERLQFSKFYHGVGGDLHSPYTPPKFKKFKLKTPGKEVGVNYITYVGYGGKMLETKKIGNQQLKK
ncbi:hypothetical protein FE74_15660, partial [Staphylococcus aureus]